MVYFCFIFCKMTKKNNPPEKENGLETKNRLSVYFSGSYLISLTCFQKLYLKVNIPSHGRSEY